MARNFAQIVFLLYAFVLLMLTRKKVLYLAENKIPAKAGARYDRTGGASRYLFLTLKPYLAPGIYYLNLTNYTLVALFALLHLVLGWFSFSSLFFKVMNSLVLLLVGFQAYLICLEENRRRFGTSFFLYRADEDPESSRAFASSVLDAVLYGILPVGMVISNFTAL